MATKKTSKQAAPKAQPKSRSKMTIFVGCCSQALDIVFVNDPAFTVDAGAGPAHLPSIRLKHPTQKFQILGLAEATVNKGTTPWQIFVVPGENPTALTAARLPKTKLKKTK